MTISSLNEGAGGAEASPESIDSVRPVETPEGVVLSLRVAGPGPRALAWMIDLLVRGVVLFLLVMFLGIVAQLLGETWAGAVMLLSMFGLLWLYPVLFEVWFQGQTPGKKSMGLMVVQRDGTPVRFAASMTRNLLRFADMMPLVVFTPTYLFGLLSCLASKDYQRLGDRVAGTVVVHLPPRGSKRRRSNEAEPVAPPVSMTPEEQRALLEFADRSSEWTREHQKSLAGELEVLTGATDDEGRRRLLGMARWIEERK